MVDEGGDLFEPPPRLLLILAVISLIQICLDPPDALCVVGLLVFLVVLMEVGDQRDHLEVRRPNNTSNQEKRCFLTSLIFSCQIACFKFSVQIYLVSMASAMALPRAWAGRRQSTRVLPCSFTFGDLAGFANCKLQSFSPHSAR